jgi:hypothetical protein
MLPSVPITLPTPLPSLPKAFAKALITGSALSLMKVMTFRNTGLF